MSPDEFSALDRRPKAGAVRGMDRLPPHSGEAEQGILGCIFLDPQASMAECGSQFGKARETVMYDLRHQTIYAAISDMSDAMEPIDIITVQQHLKDKQLLDQIGGIAYLSTLPDVPPSAANLKNYLAIVHEKYLLRRLIKTCTEVVGKVYEFEGDPDQLIEEAEREVLSIRTFSKMEEQPVVKDLVTQAMGDFETACTQKKIVGGILTGFDKLDSMTGGMSGGQMIVVAGYTSAGKSSLAMNIAEHVAIQQGLPVGVFSLEMSALELVKRSLCTHARINLRHISQGFMAPDDHPYLIEAGGAISKAGIYFDESSDLSVYEFRARARRMWQKHGIKLLLLDYLQLLNAQGGGRKVDSRQEEVSTISRVVKGLAKELGIPIIAMSQLNDDGKLRESRAIGQDGHGVWVLAKGKRKLEEVGMEHLEPIAIDLHVKKNRSGPTGSVELTFFKAITKFESSKNWESPINRSNSRK